MRKRRGFTLLEILIAMSLFTVLGFGVVLLMRTGVDMWLTGTRASVAEDQAEEGRPAARGRPAPRARAGPDRQDPARSEKPRPGQGTARRRCRRIASCPATMSLPVRRPHREVPLPRVRARHLRALAEIDMFASRAGQNPKAEKPTSTARTTRKSSRSATTCRPAAPRRSCGSGCRRATPSSAWGRCTARTARPSAGRTRCWIRRTSQSLRQLRDVIKPQPMFDNVVLVRHVVLDPVHDELELVPRRAAGDLAARPTPRPIKAGPQQCGPSRTWDSTRGILIEQQRERLPAEPDRCRVRQPKHRRYLAPHDPDRIRARRGDHLPREQRLAPATCRFTHGVLDLRDGARRAVRPAHEDRAGMGLASRAARAPRPTCSSSRSAAANAARGRCPTATATPVYFRPHPGLHDRDSELIQGRQQLRLVE